MNFAEFRAQNTAQAPKKPEAESEFEGLAGEANKSPEAEKEHQNKALLKMKQDGVWIPRTPKVPGLSESKTHHKVKIHFGNGKSEIRMVDDDELGVLRRSQHITKVFNLAEMKQGVEHAYIVPELFEDACSMQDKNTKHFKHKDGSTAYIMSHQYKDKSLGTDHYVHFSKGRGAVYSNDEGHEKAHKLLKRLGYKAKVNESVQVNEVTVAVHKAYPGKVEAVKSDLHQFHSDNGSGISSSVKGDYVHFHLPSKGHNTADNVKRTLKDHENHPAYSSENVTESYKAKE